MLCISNPWFPWEPSEPSPHCRGTAGICARGMTDRQSGRLRLGGVTVIAGCGWGERADIEERDGRQGGGAVHFKCRPPCTPLLSLHRLARCVHTFQLDATKKRPSWNCSFVSVLTVKPPPSHSPSSPLFFSEFVSLLPTRAIDRDGIEKLVERNLARERPTDRPSASGGGGGGNLNDGRGNEK